MTCPNCSAVNDPSSRFCVRCGRDMVPTSGPTVATAPRAPWTGAQGDAATGMRETPVFQPPPYAYPPPAYTGPAVPIEAIAGPGSRFGAGLVNYVILRIALVIVSAIAGVHAGGLVGDVSVGGSLLVLLYDVVRLLYSPLFWAFRGATPGMMATGTRVVREDGSRVGLGTAFLRWLIVILGAIPLFLGWFWVLWDPRHQGWHDKVAKTLVARADWYNQSAGR